MKTVVVLGALGMAGHVMVERFRAAGKFSVFAVARTEGNGVDDIIDMLDFEKLVAYLKLKKADIVINCVGVLVADTNSDMCNAIQLNSYLPQLLAKLGDQLDFKLIHISTDCVFSGKKGGYTEDSFCDGDDAYARTKTLGEVRSERHLTIRTSIIGPELKSNGVGLMHWFFSQTGNIQGYSQAFWSGVTTLELASAVLVACEKDVAGLLQLCPKQKISKFDLLQLMNAIWAKKIPIEDSSDYKVDKSLVCSREDFEYEVPDYPVMLKNLKQWIEARKTNYPHYRF